MADYAHCFSAPGPDRRGTGSLKWDRYGSDRIPLWVADMDFPAAPEILDALRARADHGVLGYTVPNDEVTDEVLAYLRRVHSFDAGPETLRWTPGMVPVLNVLCRAFAAPGEAVMTCSPVYPPFLTAPPNQDRRLVAVPLADTDAGWTFDVEAMEAAVTPDTRLFILCNPHNPVGRVYRPDELATLIAFCERHDLVLVSDEIHCDLILDDTVSHTATLALDGAAARTIALYSPSKTYNIPGLACAYAVIPDPALRRRYSRAVAGVFTEINAFGYAGCVAAYRHGEAWRQELLRVLRANRDHLYARAAAEMPGIGMRPMEATYLAWMNIEALGLERPARHFLDHGVALSDGADFGDARYLRLNFGTNTELLDAGIDAMLRAYTAAAPPAN